MHIEFDAQFDRKEYPMIGVPWVDTLAVKWIDADTPQIIQKKDRQVTMIINLRGFYEWKDTHVHAQRYR